MLETNVVSQLKHVLPLRIEPSNSELVIDRGRTLRFDNLKNAERRFLRATRRVARGEMGIGKLGAYLADLTTARRATQENKMNEDIQIILDNWKDFDMARQRSFLSEHIAKIIVDDESVDIIV